MTPEDRLQYYLDQAEAMSEKVWSTMTGAKQWFWPPQAYSDFAQAYAARALMITNKGKQ